MSRDLLRPIRLVLVAALLYGSGAQWLLLQSGAWAAMLISRSSRQPIAEAVTTTFDGRHPCRACLLVKKASTPDQTSRVNARGLTVDFMTASAVAKVAPANQHWPIFSSSTSSSRALARPAAPPPKASLPA